MTDDVINIGGLLEVAEQQQAAVAKAVTTAEVAGQRLDDAAQRWEKTSVAVGVACGKAIGEAVTKEVQALAGRLEAPFVAPLQRIQGAAVALQNTIRTIVWAWIAIAFLLGMLAGMGLLWWGLQPRLNRLLEYASATYDQTALTRARMPEVEQRKEQLPKMPAAPANVAPKKGGK